MKAPYHALVLYFAYGSNVYSPRLSARVEIVRSLGAAELSGWRFVFDKESRDGSAKCGTEILSSFETTRVDDLVRARKNRTIIQVRT